MLEDRISLATLCLISKVWALGFQMGKWVYAACICYFLVLSSLRSKETFEDQGGGVTWWRGNGNLVHFECDEQSAFEQE